jgi:hypothetical protein
MWGEGLTQEDITELLETKPVQRKVRWRFPKFALVVAVLTCFFMPFFFHALAVQAQGVYGGDYHSIAVVASAIICVLSTIFVYCVSDLEVSCK